MNNYRRSFPRTPLGWAGLGLLGVLLALMLLVDINLSYDTSHKESSQSVGSAAGTARPIGEHLQVYLAEGARLPGLKDELVAAVKESELPFADVAFVDDLPAEARANPVLVIQVLDDGGFWTPAFASRQLKVRFYYAQGWSVNREAVLNPGGATRTVSITAADDNCEGSCARGERDLTLSARSLGILSLPHMRAYVAKELAGEAVMLVKGGLPSNLNPEKWAERAGELARKQASSQAGTWSSFQRVPGCMGGVLFLGEMGGSEAWSLAYYDAPRDVITDKLTQAEIAERAGSKLGLSGVRFAGSPGFGASDKEFGLLLATVGHGSLTAAIPAGQCGLSHVEFGLH